MEKVTLHRCRVTFLKTDSHGCYQVQRALEEQGIEFDMVKTIALPRSRRKALVRDTGQVMLPAIAFADGSSYRAESVDMVAEIKAGRLFEHRGGQPASTP